jgi:N-acetylneuraminic acid mutarotase
MGTCGVTMTANQSVTATFVPLYTLSVTVSGSGAVTSNVGGINCTSGTCNASYVSGTAVTLTAAPTTGFSFSGWSGACTGMGTCGVTMTANQSVTATFVPLYTLSVTVSGSGAVTSNVGGINCTSGTCNASYVSGTAVTLTAAPTTGSSFSGWSGACTGMGTCGVTMTANQSVTATFVPLCSNDGGTWATKEPLPTAALSLAVGAHNGVVYTFGGANTTDGGTVVLDTVRAYDPTSNTWSTKASMPTARSGPAVGLVDGVFYVVGGESATSTKSQALEAYDPATNTWSTKTPMPTARSLATGTAVVGSVFYVVGGTVAGACTNVVEAYDTRTNTWSTKAPMPTPRCHHATVARHGLVYAIGGAGTGGGAFQTVEVYDPAANTWSTSAAPMPTGRQFPAVAEVHGKLYAVGGYSFSGLHKNVEVYDPDANTWSTAHTDMPTVRSSHGVAAVNGVVYAIGGSDGTMIVDKVEAYTPQPCRGTGAGSWGARAAMPPPAVVYPSGGTLFGKLYVVGGSDGSQTVGTNRVYDPAANSWSIRASATARILAASGVVNDRLYLAGGCLPGGCGGGNVVNLLEEYDPSTNQWTTKAPMPTVRSGAAAAGIDGKLYVVGGNAPCTPNCTPFYDKLEVYDPATNTWATKAPTPGELASAAAVAIDGKLYVIGGSVPNSPTTSVVVATLWVYDPQTDTWDTTRASMPTARTMPLAYALDGKLHVATGQSTGAVPTPHEVYDPPTNTWATKAAVPTIHIGGAGGVIGGRVYVVGGYRDNALNISDVLEVFEP